MIKVDNDIKEALKGIIYCKDDVIGVCDNVCTFLDILCQIKVEQCDDYRMEVEVPIDENSKRTYTYRFSKDGRLIPSSYPGVRLWTDELNSKLLFLYNFSVSHEFKL